MTILIVDDNPAVRRLIRTVIAASKADVVECMNGVEAVAAYGDRHPDVVLMDLDMPELDGLSATRQIRAADPAAHIIVVTNYDDPDLREAAQHAGARDYVLKANLLDLQRLLRSNG
jgi:two-component system KDP operon response regulator KdpE